MSSTPIAGSASGMIAAACSTRRVRSQVARLAAALPIGLSEKALMLLDTVSTARSEGWNSAAEELVCFVNPDSPSPPFYPKSPQL